MVDRPAAEIGVAAIGHSFMGEVHSHAWRTVNHVGTPAVRARMRVLAGRDSQRTAAAAHRLGWAESTSDWRSLLDRDDVHIISILTPGDSHEEIAIAALESGKHVICEKPLSTSVESAQRMEIASRAAAERGVRSMVGFNYRHVPALALARRLVLAGRLGQIRHVRAQYLQDFLVDESEPITWRLQRERAGSGALGDIGSHIVDLAQFITGHDIAKVSGTTETFVRRRPLAGPGMNGAAGSGSPASVGDVAAQATGEVTVDDAAFFVARSDDGVLMSFEATRMATGRKNAMRLEINGSQGSVFFDFESMNELWFYDRTLPVDENGYRRILATEPQHHRLENWWPAGHGLGYDHTFVHELQEFLEAVVDGNDPEPGFGRGLQIQRVLEAVQASASRDGQFVMVSAGRRAV